MRTRNQSKRHPQSTGENDAKKPFQESESQSCLESINDSGTLTDISRDAVGKLLNRVNKRGSPGLKKKDSYIHQCDFVESGSKGNDKQVISTSDTTKASQANGFSIDVSQKASSQLKVDGESINHANPVEDDEMKESDWEDGSIPTLHTTNSNRDNINKGVTIEFDASPPDSAKRKTIRRASAEEKELAELVHKIHLLCLLGRGRLIDSTCNDPLIQAALLSLLPTYLWKISEVSKLTASALVPLVNWFHNNFCIRSTSGTEKKTFHSALASVIETREGTPEEVAALSVALFRALNLSTRFVSILDVASLKPDAEKSEPIDQERSRAGRGIFNSSTLMVERPSHSDMSPVKQSALDDKNNVSKRPLKGSCKTKGKATTSTARLKDSPAAHQGNDKLSDPLPCEVQNDISVKESKGSKRKGDIEFEMELQMALSATSAGSSKTNVKSDAKDLHSNSSKLSSPFKRLKKIKSEESSASSQVISTALGSRKVGAPLYWAEVYCSGENLTGKWVHVDAVNAIIDGEQRVEAAAAACKTPLRYAVAFAGHGVKDVTRRYCMQWYKIAPQRVNSIWWDEVLAPLKELESRATGGVVHLKQEALKDHDKVEASKLSDHLTLGMLKENDEKMDAESSSMRQSFAATRTDLEDMELQTRALTEPLPTNQQAYKNHQLYAIERWLTKYQILHPKGPVLGLCSGHPVYPRTCVQTLHTKERWLREGLQIKANELPVKVLKRSVKAQAFESDDYGEKVCGGTVALYGKWQTEPLSLPHAVDGIVPKNERGQVDVWSEKCLPPGTVHLKFPRIFAIAKKLEIDYAPAMVGFEFRNGRSIPVYDGIVVCSEFKDVILEAYAEEEERRGAEERKRNEAQAISRWYQLLSSIVTRQRLNNRYGDDGVSSYNPDDMHKPNEDSRARVSCSKNKTPTCGPEHENRGSSNKRDTVPPVSTNDHEHEHVYLKDDQTFDEESSIRTKRCRCGFSIQVEEL